MSPRVTIEGLPELQKKLEKAGGNVEAATDRALFAGARIIAEAARAKAPVASGTMRTAILARPAGKGVAEAASPTWYSHFPEYGTLHMAARPFMRPAADERGQAAGDEVCNVVRVEIEAAMRR